MGLDKDDRGTTVDYLINRGTGPFTIEMKDAIGQDLTSVANNTALANTITSASVFEQNRYVSPGLID